MWYPRVWFIIWVLCEYSYMYWQEGHSHLRELAGYKSRFLHRDRNLEIFTSVDINISLIIAISIALQIAIHLAIIWELARLLHRGGCVNARANNLGIFYPIIPSERIKTRAMLEWHAQFGDQNHPARRSSRCFRLSEQAQNISVFQSWWKSRSFLCMNAPNITWISDGENICDSNQPRGKED